jgi:hypothetical protein
MATNRNNTFVLKVSNVTGKTPTTANLVLGEVAVNTADAKMYSLFTGGASAATEVRQIGWDKLALTGGTLSGSVYGPSFSATSISATTFYGNGSNLTGVMTGIGVIGSSPNASGGTLSGTTLVLQPANETYGGILTNTSQTIGGNKTFGNSNTISSNAVSSFGFGTSHVVLGTACIGLGEASYIEGEANTAVYGFGNATTSDVTDSLVGGTGSNAVGGSAIIALGVANNGYTGYTTAIGGENNVISGIFSSTYGGLGNNVYGSYSGVFSGLNNVLNGNNSVIIGGIGIVGDDDNTLFTENVKILGNVRLNTTSGNTYIGTLATGLTPPTTSGATKMLIVDANGLISSSAIISGNTIIGSSFNNSTLRLTNNTGGTVSTLINNFSGITTTGTVTAAIVSATTISGGTIYGDGSNLTNIVGAKITGGTFTNNNLVLTNNTGGTISTYLNSFSGLTINGILSATTISGVTIYGNGSNLTGIQDNDRYYTGSTFTNNNLTLLDNSGSSLTTLINNFSGLTVNGVLSASTISGNSIYGTWRGDYIDKKILAYRAMGSTIVAENVDGQLAAVNAGQTMVSQRLYISAVYLDKVQSITGLKWRQITAGSYSGNNYNGVAMYSYSAGTLSLVASSTTDNNIWAATTGSVGVKAFSTPYSAQAGLYFVGYLYNAASATTAPNIGILGAASSVNTVTDFTNSAKTSGLISSQTSLPTSLSMSSISAAATEYWGGLYGT